MTVPTRCRPSHHGRDEGQWAELFEVLVVLTLANKTLLLLLSESPQPLQGRRFVDCRLTGQPVGKAIKFERSYRSAGSRQTGNQSAD